MKRKTAGPARVLVVDDDEAVLALVKAVLEAAEIEVAVATSGEEGVHLFRESRATREHYQLVLLDITLPGGMTGVETLDELRSIDPAVKVIASSGYFDDSVADAAKKRGFVGILPKPYPAERLTKMVQWGVNKAA